MTSSNTILTLPQEQCLNRVVHLISRGDHQSATQVLSMKDNPLGEAMSSKILATISKYSVPIITLQIKDMSEKEAYKILLNGPKKTSQIGLCDLFSYRDILKKIFSYLEAPSKDMLALRLVNHYLAENVFSLTLLWKSRFSSSYPSFQGVNFDADLYLKLARVDKNIRSLGSVQHYTFDNRKLAFSEYTNFKDMHLCGNRLALVDDFGKLGIKIWDLNEKKLEQIIYPENIADNPRFWTAPHIKMTDEHLYFVMGKTIGVWNLNKDSSTTSPHKVFSRKDALGEIAGHRGKVLDIQLEGHYLYSSSEDGMLKIWDCQTGNIVQKIMVNKEERTYPGKILVTGNHIYEMSSEAIYGLDSRTAKTEILFKQNKTSFSAMVKDDSDLCLGTSHGRVYSWDPRGPSNLLQRCKTSTPVRISHLCLEGNYLFSQSSFNSTCGKGKCFFPQSAPSQRYTDGSDTVEVFEKDSGQSLQILENTIPFFKSVIGMTEKIRNMQIHRGVLYVNSYYSSGDPVIIDIFNVDRTAVKAWDFSA